MILEASGPNAEQIAYWNGAAASRWVALAPFVDAQISCLGRAVMDRAVVAPGERVLDVGCGCGQTCLQLAERVGTAGTVTGIDISAVMIDLARSRARERQLEKVRFENADAQTFPFAPDSFDLVFSRFGVTFFADPTAAFANLADALAPGGRLAFVCWQALERNPWMRIPLVAATRHIPLPEPPAAGAPGPFSFADADRVCGVLEGAGFVEIGSESLECELLVGGGGDLEQTVDFVLQIGPAAAALRRAGEASRPAVAGSVREALAPYVTPKGVRLGSASWIVTASTRLQAA